MRHTRSPSKARDHPADLPEASIEGADFRDTRLLSARLPEERGRATFTGALMPDNTIQR